MTFNAGDGNDSSVDRSAPSDETRDDSARRHPKVTIREKPSRQLIRDAQKETVVTGKNLAALAKPASKIPFLGEEARSVLLRSGAFFREKAIGKVVGSLPRSLPETGEAIGGVTRSALSGLAPIFERLGSPLRLVMSLFGRFGPLLESIGGVVSRVIGFMGPVFETLAPLLAPVPRPSGACSRPSAQRRWD